MAKKPVRSGKYDINYVWLCSCEFKVLNVAHEIDSMQLLSKLSRMNEGQEKKSAKAPVCDDAQDACVRDAALILKFQCRKNKYISAGKGWS